MRKPSGPSRTRNDRCTYYTLIAIIGHTRTRSECMRTSYGIMIGDNNILTTTDTLRPSDDRRNRGELFHEWSKRLREVK